MPDRFLVNRDDGSCALVRLSPYPVVTSGDSSVTVTPTTDPVTGQVTYDVGVVVDVNVDNVSYDAASSTLTVTETDGTIHNVDLADLVDPPSSMSQVVTTGNEIAVHDDGSGNTTSIFESVSTVTLNGDGSFTHTSEDGTVTTLDLCTLISEFPDLGFYSFT